MVINADQRHQEVLRGRLAEAELENDVEILFAVESGSRAWGFPSTDSDWDVRYVYRRPLTGYLSLGKTADTIGRSVKGALYDVNGWDVGKALQQALGSNATLLEWLCSPVRYRWSEEADKVAEVAKRLANPRALTWHYFNLLRNFMDDRAKLGESLSMKKYFYGLRPALALRHLRMFPGVPPMNLRPLVESTDLQLGEVRDIQALVDVKAGRTEQEETTLGGGASQRLNALMDREFELAEATKPEKNYMVDDSTLRRMAERAFHEIIGASKLGVK